MDELIFTRPGNRCEIKERLIEDIKNTKFRIYLAMAYFSDQDIYDAMHESSAPTALFILNEGDIQNINGRRSRSFDLVRNYDIHTVILGDERYSKMHHKFIILDNIAYIGSYNFSYPASNQTFHNKPTTLALYCINKLNLNVANHRHRLVTFQMQAL